MSQDQSSKDGKAKVVDGLQSALLEHLSVTANIFKQLLEARNDEPSSSSRHGNEEMEALLLQNGVLTIKHRQCNDELEEARKELIEFYKENQINLEDDHEITVKMMGDIDCKPFLDACSTEDEAATLVSVWQTKLSDPMWHPFHVYTVAGEHKEILDENDPELRNLKEEWGDDVHNAVVKALTELNEYNSSGGYVVPELWNPKEKRRAHLKEVLKHLLKMVKVPRQPRK